VGEQLNPQDGLYTLARNRRGRLRVIGSVAEVLLATKSAPHCAAWLRPAPISSPSPSPKGLLPRGRWQPRSGAGRALPAAGRCVRPRKAAGIGGLTLLSCDNLADNGHQLRV
jgi:fructuronate reductase